MENIIFVFVERTSADSCALCCILYSVHFTRVQKLLCLHNLQQDFRNRTFPHYKIFLFLCYWFLPIFNLPVRSLKTFVFTHWIYYHTTPKYARNISAESLCKIIIPQHEKGCPDFRQPFLFFYFFQCDPFQICIDENINSSVKYCIHISGFLVGTMILDHSIWLHNVGTNLVTPAIIGHFTTDI